MPAARSNHRRNQILQAASRLIAHYGFDKTTMEDIAREAGVSKGALYLEWPGKHELFEALLVHEMRRLLLDFQQRVERDPQGGQIANMYRHALLALRDNPLVSALYTQDSRVLGDYIKRQDTSRYTSRLLVGEQAVRQMQAAGLLRADIRPEVIAYLMSLIAVGLLQISSIIPTAEQPPLEDVADGLTRLIQGGLAGPGNDSAAGREAAAKIIDLILQQYNEEEK